jgi:predicted RNA-binding protein YlqC (UPF0109 family)
MFEEDINISPEIALVKYIAEQLVENKHSISIKRTEDEKGVLLTLLVEGEIGRVIGRSGKIVKSIRTLLKILSHKIEEKVFLRVEEVEKKAH